MASKQYGVKAIVSKHDATPALIAEWEDAKKVKLEVKEEVKLEDAVEHTTRIKREGGTEAEHARSIDLKGIDTEDVKKVLSACPGLTKVWNLRITEDFSILAHPTIKSLRVLGLNVAEATESPFTAPTHLSHLEFQGDLADQDVAKLLAKLVIASANTLQHLDLMDCKWHPTSRRELFATLVQAGIPPRLTSLGLPFARGGGSEDDDDFDEDETEDGHYLSVEEVSFLKKCTSIKTLGCFRLPELDDCPATVDSILVWFHEIFPDSPFEYMISPLLPQLRRLRIVGVAERDHIMDEEWAMDLMEGHVALLADADARKLRFGIN
ncbi:hypothetical protein RQP46_006626 [Phenoliferia psychrophenolica]